MCVRAGYIDDNIFHLRKKKSNNDDDDLEFWLVMVHFFGGGGMGLVCPVFGFFFCPLKNKYFTKIVCFRC